MDIDVTRKAKATPDTCQRCGKTGHWAKDCNLRFDVQYMDADELEIVRATAVGRDAERNAERDAVLAGDPKGLDYYVILL